MGIKCKVITTLDSTREVPRGFIKVVEDSTTTTEYEFEYELFQDVFVVEQNWRGKWVVKQRMIDAFAFTNIPSYHMNSHGFVLPDYIFDDYDKAKEFADILNRK